MSEINPKKSARKVKSKSDNKLIRITLIKPFHDFLSKKKSARIQISNPAIIPIA